MNLKPLLLMLGLACIPATLAAQKTYSLSSPDGNLRTTVTVGDEIRLRLDAGDTPLLAPSPVAMTLEGGEVLGQNARVSGRKRVPSIRRSPRPSTRKTGSWSVTTS